MVWIDMWCAWYGYGISYGGMPYW